MCGVCGVTCRGRGQVQLEINQVYYFLEICKTGKMSKAAENLHITQQGLSVSMRRLEEELSCDLFYRKSNGLVLTEDGQFFKTEAEKVVRHFEKIKTHYAEKQQNKTALSVAVTDSIIVRLPIKLQRLFINGNDNFVVNLVETYSKPCADAVAESEADFAVIYGRFRDDVLEYKTLDNVQQVIIVIGITLWLESGRFRWRSCRGSPLLRRINTAGRALSWQSFSRSMAQSLISYMSATVRVRRLTSLRTTPSSSHGR